MAVYNAVGMWEGSVLFPNALLRIFTVKPMLTDQRVVWFIFIETHRSLHVLFNVLSNLGIYESFVF